MVQLWRGRGGCTVKKADPDAHAAPQLTDHPAQEGLTGPDRRPYLARRRGLTRRYILQRRSVMDVTSWGGCVEVRERTVGEDEARLDLWWEGP
jgi:hypothetical protein